MASNSGIEWTHHTFNPWRGCTKVSEGCRYCYAETMSKRNLKVLGQWGPNGTRVIAAESYWREPFRWQRWAATGVCSACGGKGELWNARTERWDACVPCDMTGKVTPYRARVFCASLADVFEGPETMPETAFIEVRRARVRLMETICATPDLDWLLPTKRPHLIDQALQDVIRDAEGDSCASLMVQAWLRGDAPGNVWLGTSVEDQQAADQRIPHLLRCPAAVRFLSCEPLLGPLRFADVPGFNLAGSAGQELLRNLWIIVGGESQAGARPCNVEWIRSIVGQCRHAGVPVFVKQLGRRPYDGAIRSLDDKAQLRSWLVGPHAVGRGFVRVEVDGRDVAAPAMNDPKGGDWNEWPADLRVREFPAALSRGAAGADAKGQGA